MEYYDNPDEICFTAPLLDLAKLGIEKDSKILDLGCGYGRCLENYFKQGFEKLTGIDISEKLIERAKKNIPEARLLIGSILNLDELLGCEKYNVIVMSGVLEYIITHDDRICLLNTIKKYLVKNGKVIIETFLMTERDIPQKGLYCDYGMCYVNGKFFLRHDQIISIDDMFGNLGYKKTYYEKTDFITWHDKIVPGYIAKYEII